MGTKMVMISTLNRHQQPTKATMVTMGFPAPRMTPARQWVAARAQ